MGLGAKLVGETLPLAGTDYVEMPAVMASTIRLRRAGMRKVAEQHQPKEALAIMKVLEGLGFNCQLLGSRSYVLEKLKGLADVDVAKVKAAFAKYKHPRFRKSFSQNLPYGRSSGLWAAMRP